MRIRLQSLLRSAAALGIVLFAAAPASAAPFDDKGDGNGDGDGDQTEACAGCAGEYVMGATVSVPGYTITIEEGDPNPDDGKDHDNDGKCHIVSQICTEKKGCEVYTKYTFKAAKKAKLTACWWRQQDDGTWKWECLVVNPGFQGSSSHVENEAKFGCGDSMLRRTILGPSSVAWSMVCNQCAN